MAKSQKVFMKPAGDDYQSFKAFISSFVQALKPGETIEDDEESTRRAYEKYLAAKRKSGASEKNGASR